MQLSWGSYLFSANACKIATKIVTRFNKASQRLSTIRSISVDGYLEADGQTAISAAMIALEDALLNPNQDLILYQDDGSRSGTYLLNSTSISGVRIVEGPDFPDSIGYEYSKGRHFTFTAEGEYAFNDNNQRLTSFTEKLEFSGGGPEFIVRPAKLGPAQRQQIWQNTPYRVVQTGEAFGYSQYPRDPVIFFGARLAKSPDIRLIAPNRVGPNGYEEYGKSWTILYESETILNAKPTLWIG